MSLSLIQFRDYVVRPVLSVIGFNGKAAERLLLGTALTESGLVFMKQVGSGPALGVYQMEPKTHDDIWVNFLNYKADLSAEVKQFVFPGMDDCEQLAGNLYYATAMCRVHYLRKPAALPDEDDLPAMGAYWKQYYNTPLGKGTVADFITKAKPAFEI